MALTKQDLRDIRAVVDESIDSAITVRVEPRLNALDKRIDDTRELILDQVTDVIKESMTLVADRFDALEKRLGLERF
jgi:hypothetical protein